MKAVTAVCATGASLPAIASGRISRHRDGENAEIQMYLSKLKDLVPFMPKNRKLSKLEIIQYVIDYICDLQSELEMHPAVNNFDPVAALNGSSSQQSSEQTESTAIASSQHQRQPLCDRSNPNAIISNNCYSNNNNSSITLSSSSTDTSSSNHHNHLHQFTTNQNQFHTTGNQQHHRSQH